MPTDSEVSPSTPLLTACKPLALAADAASLEAALMILAPATGGGLRTRAAPAHPPRTGTPDAERWADAIEATVRKGGAPAHVLDAIERVHQRARERLEETKELDEGLLERLHTLRPPGVHHLAPDGTPVWADRERTMRTIAGWLCEHRTLP